MSPIPSAHGLHLMATMGEAARPEGDIASRLRDDLVRVVRLLRRFSMDFRKGQGVKRTLLEEGTFSAQIAIFLEGRGWSVEREAVQRTGRTDIKASLAVYPGHVVVEVKRWSNQDRGGIHRQTLSYGVHDTLAFAAVMIFEATADGARYDSECLHEVDVVDTPPDEDILLRIAGPERVLHLLVGMGR